MIAAVMLMSSAYAAEITVVEHSIPHIRGRAYVDTSFYMNRTTNEGFVNVTVTDEFLTRNVGIPCLPYEACQSLPTSTSIDIFQDSIKVDGLELIDNKIMFQSTDGAVECGTLGVSRVLRRPTIYLNGNCQLTAKILRESSGNRVIVKLKTK